MNEVHLPALTGSSALGVLAGMGVLRLLADFSDCDARLRWERSSLSAVLCSTHADVDSVVAALAEIVAAIPEGSVLPGVGPGFPPPGAAPDKLRVPQAELRPLDESLFKTMSPAQGREGRRWLASLVTDLAVDKDGRAAISQFTAPSGKQSMSTMLEKPLDLVRSNPEYLRQALVGWRRVPGVTGEYLDHRAMWDAAEDGRGSPSMRGVPGATWLALMSYPLFRTTGSARKRPLSSGWHTAKSAAGRSYDELRLPLWEQPLGPVEVTALVEHPALASVPERLTPADERQLAQLGIIHVCRSRRYQPPGGKSAGVLTTIP